MNEVFVVYNTFIDRQNSLHLVESEKFFSSREKAKNYCESKKVEYIYSCAGTVWGYRIRDKARSDRYDEYLTITRYEVE